MRLAVGDNAWDRVRGSCVADYAAGRRTPCAGRAVILTAIQSLRRVVGRGATLYGVVVILVRVRMGGEFGGSRAGAQRYRGACWERSPSWGSALPGARTERGASSEARVRSLACPGLWGEGPRLGRASGLAPGKRQQASAFQGLRRGSWLGEGLVGALRAQIEL